MSPDQLTVSAFLRRAQWRMTMLLVLHGVATGLAVAVVIRLLVHQSLLANTPWFLGVGIAVGAVRGWQQRRRIAAVVEARAPECENILVTAAELLARPAANTGYVNSLVFRDAARQAQSLPLGSVLPFRGAVTSLAVVLAVWGLVLARPSLSTEKPSTVRGASGTGDLAEIDAVDVEVSAPAYLGVSPAKLHNPASVVAPAGSRARFTIHSGAATLTVASPAGTRLLRPSSGVFAIDVPIDSDAFVALQPSTPGAGDGLRHIIALSATPDAAPVVKITAPARDLRLPDGKRSVAIAIEASDDHALASLRLRYTRVSGSGERFTFTDGEVPLHITRTDAAHWKAQVSWRLDSLALEPGDMVVYRAVAADGRPDAHAVESDSWIAEVAAPGGVAAAGFEVDPEVERYALSEQMVIVKTEKLLALKPSISADSFRNVAADIAVEQRRVRAEYVFMMGGEVGGVDDAAGDLNEEAEASGEGDLAMQRLLNQGRNALLSSIRAMSRAAAALTTPDVPLAVTHEKEALAQLEKTFAHTRLILRALTQRERLDMTRRLTGTLADVSRDKREAGRPAQDARIASLQRLLTAVINAGGRDSLRGAGTLAALASEALRIDPSSAALHGVAAELDSAGAATTRHQNSSIMPHLNRAALALSHMVAEATPASRATAWRGDAATMAGAAADAARRLRGGP